MRDDLLAWNIELLKYAVPIHRARVDWLSRTAAAAEEIQVDLGGAKSQLKLTYSQGVTGPNRVVNLVISRGSFRAF